MLVCPEPFRVERGPRWPGTCPTRPPRAQGKTPRLLVRPASADAGHGRIRPGPCALWDERACAVRVQDASATRPRERGARCEAVTGADARILQVVRTTLLLSCTSAHA